MTKIWFQHKEHAEDIGKLRMIAIAQKLPPEDYAAIMERRFEVIPNTADDRGGYLVIIGSSTQVTAGSDGTVAHLQRSIRNRLFGTGEALEEGDREIFATRFGDHLKRVNTLGGPYSAFIEQYLSGDVLPVLSAGAAEKMALTRSDFKEHSYCYSRAPVSYWICTIPYSVPDAKQWFVDAYGGYSKLLERAWNSDYFKDFGCEVLVHVVFGRPTEGGWVNLTIFPVGTQRFGIKPVLPIDLLTEGEKNP
ncbi:MAG: hypothetical protein OJF50_005651 [Nitrospira sp.]|jgi:hypothetical protein|nr:hypothetical protein [Nitrospira sp.]